MKPEDVHSKMLKLHIKALSAHCECLGMNAENCYAVSIGNSPPYGDDAYIQVMKKWGLVNEDGSPVI